MTDTANDAVATPVAADPIVSATPVKLDYTRIHQGFFLTFSTRCKAYAELGALIHFGAVFNLALSPSLPGVDAAATVDAGVRELHAGLCRNLLAPHPSLLVRRCPVSEDRAELNDKTAILRYIYAAAQQLQPETAKPLTPAQQVAHDDWIDAVHAGLAAVEAKLKAAAHDGRGGLLGAEVGPQPADWLLWDLVMAQGGPASAAVQTAAPLAAAAAASLAASPEAAPATSQAIHIVDELVKHAPLYDVYRYDMAEQVAAILDVPVEKAVACIEVPSNTKNGDLSLVLPRLGLTMSPVAAAQKLATEFKLGTAFAAYKAMGPFFNLTFAEDHFRNALLPRIMLDSKSQYGHSSEGLGKIVVIDYSSPNIAKPFHAGHLRSTMIGTFVANLLNARGIAAVSLNYLGDWGKQYGLLAVGFDKYGSEAQLAEDPIRHLYEVYVKINTDSENEREALEAKRKAGTATAADEANSIQDQARAYFTRMENGDAEALALWRKFRELSIVKYKQIYERINVHFDVYSGESEYDLTCMQGYLEKLRAMGLMKVDAGAEIVDLNAFSMGVALIAKKDGSMLYLSRDIAAAHDRAEKYQPDQLLYVVGNQQDHHFRQLFKILELMGSPMAGKCQHLNFGLIKSKDGSMSTRRGKVVFLQDIIDQTQEEMHDVMKANEAKYAHIADPLAVADNVAVSSIVVQDMSARRHLDYEFDWGRMLSFEGDTGPYLQYAHARLCSIERQAQPLKPLATWEEIAATSGALTEPQAAALLRALAAWPDVLTDASVSYEPCTIVKYALRMSRDVSRAVEALYVRNQPEDIARARLTLFVAARKVLGQTLSMIGLRPLERM